MLTKQEALVRAEELARKYHAAQTDLAGAPYIEHLKAVVNGVEFPEEKTVAWLHDIVEDTPVTIEFLREQGFSEDVLTAVSLITRQKPCRYDLYISALSCNTLARRVKIADLRNNLDLSRLPAEMVELPRTKRRVQVYQGALDTLTAIETGYSFASLG